MYACGTAERQGISKKYLEILEQMEGTLAPAACPQKKDRASVRTMIMNEKGSFRRRSLVSQKRKSRRFEVRMSAMFCLQISRTFSFGILWSSLSIMA